MGAAACHGFAVAEPQAFRLRHWRASLAAAAPPTEAICGHNPPSFPIREYLSSREMPSPLTKPPSWRPTYASPPAKAQSQTKPPRTLPFCRIFAPKTNPVNHCLCNKKVVLYSSIDIHIYRRSLGRTENSGCHGFLPTYKGGRPAILSPFSGEEALRQKRRRPCAFPPWWRKYDRCRR